MKSFTDNWLTLQQNHILPPAQKREQIFVQMHISFSSNVHTHTYLHIYIYIYSEKFISTNKNFFLVHVHEGRKVNYLTLKSYQTIFIKNINWENKSLC